MFYWEVQLDAVLSTPSDFCWDKRLWAPFAPKAVAIEIDYGLLDRLLKEALALWNTSTPPDRTPKCDDCKKLDFMFALEDQLVAADHQTLRDFWDRADVTNKIKARDFKRRSAWNQAMTDFCTDDLTTFADDGMITAWES